MPRVRPGCRREQAPDDQRGPVAAVVTEIGNPVLRGAGQDGPGQGAGRQEDQEGEVRVFLGKLKKTDTREKKTDACKYPWACAT